ncbi:MAG: DUF393 domain-containing protein [Woeseiaceae bacterium]
MNNAIEQDNPDVTVWYDSECPLCIREINLMRHLDKRNAINFVEIQTAVGCPISTDELMKRFHAQERGEPIVSGAAAFAAMWRAIPILKHLGLLARFKPVLWVLERMYLGFLKFRPWLQRRVRQMVKT